MKFKAKILREIYWGDNYSDLSGEYEVVEESRWVSSHKCELSFIIFKHNDLFYKLHRERSGSPYTEYWYNDQSWKDDQDIKCSQVNKVETTTYEWKEIK